MTKRSRTPLLVLAVIALLAAACGDDDDASTDTSAPDTTASTTTPGSADDGAAEDDGAAPPQGELTASFRGVTEDTIKIGVAMIDFQQLKDNGFLDFTFGDQELSYQAVIDEINEDGGVLGRQLEPVYEVFFPVGAAEGEAMCVRFTEDEEVFAVIGVIPNLFPTVIDCIVGTHETIHVGHGLTRALMDQYGGMLASSDIVADRKLEALLAVLKETGELEGRTIAVFGDQNEEARIEDVVVPLLEELGVDVADVGIIDTSSADTNQINAATQVVAERFRTSGVDTILAVGFTAPSRFPTIRSVMPDVEFWADNTEALLDIGQSSDDKSPFEGAITLEALNEDDGEQFNHPSTQDCLDIFRRRQPDIELKIPGELTTDEPNWFAGLRDACNELEVFVMAAEAAGPDLTNESWVAALESLGEVQLVGKEYASFGPAKWDGEDGFRLVAFSSSVGLNGGFEARSEIVDVTG